LEVLRAPTGHDNAGALGSKRQRDAASNARAAARDDRTLAREAQRRRAAAECTSEHGEKHAGH